MLLHHFIFLHARLARRRVWCARRRARQRRVALLNAQGVEGQAPRRARTEFTQLCCGPVLAQARDVSTLYPLYIHSSVEPRRAPRESHIPISDTHPPPCLRTRGTADTASLHSSPHHRLFIAHANTLPARDIVALAASTARIDCHHHLTLSTPSPLQPTPSSPDPDCVRRLQQEDSYATRASTSPPALSHEGTRRTSLAHTSTHTHTRDWTRTHRKSYNTASAARAESASVRANLYACHHEHFYIISSLMSRLFLACAVLMHDLRE
jgi:hypothetical protein